MISYFNMFKNNKLPNDIQIHLRQIPLRPNCHVQMSWIGHNIIKINCYCINSIYIFACELYLTIKLN